MGLSTILLCSPTPGLCGDVADNRLAAWIDVNMLNPDGLLTTAAEFCQRLGLHHVRPQELMIANAFFALCALALGAFLLWRVLVVARY
jgi:hypothetical protein